MSKLFDMISIVKTSMEKTKEIVNVLTAMGHDLANMVAQLKNVLPKRKREQDDSDDHQEEQNPVPED